MNVVHEMVQMIEVNRLRSEPEIDTIRRHDDGETLGRDGKDEINALTDKIDAAFEGDMKW